jgi:hypothetical protein
VSVPSPWRRCVRRAGVAVAALIVSFVVLAAAVAFGDPTVVALDAHIGAALDVGAASCFAAVMSALSAVHVPRGIAVLTAVASLVMWRGRGRAAAVVLVASVAGGSMLNFGLKQVFRRARPDVERALETASGFAFRAGTRRTRRCCTRRSRCWSRAGRRRARRVLRRPPWPR